MHGTVSLKFDGNPFSVPVGADMFHADGRTDGEIGRS
jgi:hypothetical protein